MLPSAPRLARRLLAALLPASLRDDVLTNLDDLYALRTQRKSRLRARLWYWRQALLFPVRLRLAAGSVPDARESGRAAPVRSVLQDVQYAFRLNRAHPGLAIAAIVSLAAGIGLNTAIFSVVDGVLLRPSPVTDLDRVVMVWETDRHSGTTREPASVPDFLDFSRRARTLQSLGAFLARDVTFTPQPGDPLRLASLSVSQDLLPTLGLKPLIGRLFSAGDDAPHAPPVAVISEALWRRLFDGDPAIVGRLLRIDDAPVTIVGVVRDGSDFGVMQILDAAAYARAFADRVAGTHVDLWMPLAADPHAFPRSTHPVFLLGRLARGASSDQAQQELASIAADLERTYPSDNDGRGVHVEPLGDVVFGPVRPTLLALYGAVGLVLLAACVNVASLLVARGAARQREVAIRSALGAGAWRLGRQFVTEAVGLAVAGGAGGVALAYAVLHWLVAAGPPTVPRLASATIDTRVLLVTLGLSLAVGVLAGIFPAFQAIRASPRATLAGDATRTATDGRDRSRLRAVLVVTELALATMLAAGAGLLIRSFWRLHEVDPGFRAAGVIKAEYQLPPSRYPVDFKVWPDFKEMHAFRRRLLDRAAAVPGVIAASVAANQPLDAGSTNSFVVVGREAEAKSWPEISVRRVTPGYFDTVGLPLERGRLIRDGDGPETAPVALVNAAAAARFFTGSDPIGHDVRMWGRTWRIVGVVGNERFLGLTRAAPPALYLSLFQAPSIDGAGTLLLKTAGDPGTLAAAARALIHGVDPELAVFGVEPLAATVARSTSEQRFTMVLLGLFALMALGLAAVGVHGVLSYGVARRTREIGVRLALGARPGRLRRTVLAEGLRLAAGGLLVGMAGAFALSRLLRLLLFGVTPTDPATFAGVAAVLLLVAALASYLPARRATRIDPCEALRADV
jgi:putative ABC transport system permease protein